MDSTFYTEEKKIPMPLAIILIIFLFGILSFILRKPVKTDSQAQKINLVASSEITNVTGNSAVIIVCLSKNVMLQLTIRSDNENGFKTVKFDDRDIPNNPVSRNCHYFTLRDLDSGNYTAEAMSNGAIVGDKPITFQTGDPVKQTNLPPLWGKFIDKAGHPIETGIVIANFENSKPISSLIKNGDWLLPLHYLAIIPGDATKYTLTALGSKGEKTVIQNIFKRNEQINKTLVLGQSYDFTKINEDQSILGQTTSSDIPLQKIDIIYPHADVDIPSSKPLFKGVGIPNKKMIIIIDEFASISKKTKYKDKKYEITIQNDGVWTFTPYNNLLPGFHNVVIKTQDENGRSVSIKRNYTILKSGENVLGIATPSAELTPTETPQTNTITPTTPVTPEPTIITAQATATPKLPRSGMNVVPFGVISVSFIMTGIGILLFYL